MKLHITIMMVLLSVVNMENKMKMSYRGKIENLLIFINDNVPEGDGILLKNIQKKMLAAFQTIYKATNNLNNKQRYGGIVFDTVYIRVPLTWTLYNDSQIATWHQCNKADMFVSLQTNEDQSEPYTKQLHGCGRPASFTKFPHLFFFQSDQLKTGKKILNEFVRLRYGVFPETPYKYKLTKFNGLHFINGTCGSTIQWRMSDSADACSSTGSGCTYTILPKQNHSYSVSFDIETPSSTYFCNDDNRPHNQLAYNLQNIKCSQRSISSVILDHSDFNQYRRRVPYQVPKFVIVKGMKRKLVLVLDISGSMSSIIDNMLVTVSDFIQNIVEADAKVGLVSFSNKGRILSGLRPMQPNNKEIVANLINNLKAEGGTNIPDGLRKGVQVLGGNIDNNREVFGTIILLSDGGNNMESNNYEYFIEQLIKKGIVVNAIAYGKNADKKLTNLTRDTHGKFHHAETSIQTAEFSKMFSSRHSCEIVLNELVQAMEGTVNIDIGGTMIVTTDLGYLDAFLGTDVKIAFPMPKQTQGYNITLINPEGRRITPTKRTTQGNNIKYIFTLPNPPVHGMYKIEVKKNKQRRIKRNVNNNSFAVTFTVTARPIANKRRILPTGSISTSEIPLLNAETKVLATVDLTECEINKNESAEVTLILKYSQGTQKFTMLDDGKGGDNIEGDLIYSKMLRHKQFPITGFYTFKSKILIKNKKKNYTIKRNIELGSLRLLKRMSVIEDKIAPAKIDMVEIDAITSKRTVVLGFDAVGNDGMSGQIEDYEILVSFANQTRLFNFTNKRLPKEKVATQLDLSNTDVSSPFNVRIRGKDKNGNVGEWSFPMAYNWNYEEIRKKYQKDDDNNNGNMVTVMPYLLTCQICLLYILY